MLKVYAKKFITFCRKIFADCIKFIKGIQFKKKISEINFSLKYMIYGILLFFILYYPVGALIMQDIDTDANADISVSSPMQSTVVNAMAYVVEKETNANVWTPNLPFLFPAYILDNMPAFQIGEMEAVSATSKALANTMAEKLGDNGKALSDAAEYFSYAPDVWLFAPQSNKIFAPSSSTQYGKGKRALVAFNQQLRESVFVFPKVKEDLFNLLKSIEHDLSDSAEEVRAHIRENSSSFFDNKADDVFYKAKGKLYAYYLIVKALSRDYKNIMTEVDIYQKVTLLLNLLEEGAEISPLIVRNAQTDDSFAPNHLAYADMYIYSAIDILKDIVQKGE